jgi:hypothetical protein
MQKPAHCLIEFHFGESQIKFASNLPRRQDLISLPPPQFYKRSGRCVQGLQQDSCPIAALQH